MNCVGFKLLCNDTTAFFGFPPRKNLLNSKYCHKGITKDD